MELSKTAINKIGEIIRSGEKTPDYSEALEKLNIWREGYGTIMAKYYKRCLRLRKRPDLKGVMVTRRLKRLPTIVDKLRRFPNMSLARMQDVAGVRIVAENMEQMSKIEKRIKRWKSFDREKNYVENPKEDGYRGKHFIFKEHGQFIEIQLRTQIQHIWATTIETVDAFNGSIMKTGGKCDFWYDFFRQASAILAIVERTNNLEGFRDKSISEICTMLYDNMEKNNIRHRLKTIEIAKQVFSNNPLKGGEYYLVLDLNFREKICHIYTFKKSEYELAVLNYQKLEEKLNKSNNVVMISVSNIKELENLYPNYFLNLRLFDEVLDFILAKYVKKG